MEDAASLRGYQAVWILGRRDARLTRPASGVAVRTESTRQTSSQVGMYVNEYTKSRNPRSYA